jgi:HD-like signal output (HDOD) protein/tRNA A-37 threonylcarbamoyl transferase component Bud32
VEAGSTTVDRKLSLSTLLDNPHVPTPPALALQIIDKVSQPDCAPRDILVLLQQDPGLCGKVLKTVNSSLFGLPRPVASLDRAIAVLGLKPLRSLVLGLSLPAIQKPSSDGQVWKYWHESVSGAVIARELAVKLRRPDPDGDLVAALLRDIGTLVLQQLFPDEYRALWTDSAAGGQCERETAAFGIDHTEVSAGILNSWRMPEDVVLPIRYHHYPARLPEVSQHIRQRAWLLCFAAKTARMGVHHSNLLGEVVQLARTHFGMDQPALVKFLESVTPKIEDFAKILQIEIGQCHNFAAIVSAGCEELVRLTVESSRNTQPPSAPLPQAGVAGPIARTTAKAAPVPQRLSTPAIKPSPSKPAPSTQDFDLACLEKGTAKGANLGGYEVQQILGRGAMGVVFKALDPVLQRFVAIKMLTRERLVLSEARERFQREARAAAAVQHPNVITIHAVGEFNCMPYLVMEYVAGLSLQDKLDQNGALPMAEVIGCARQLAAGLEAAHSKGVIHRDIKPANLLVHSASGTVKITDFGLARVQDGKCLSTAGMFVGTPLYMAPEQFSGKGVDHRADLFSFGSVLYTLCTGRPAFEGDTLVALMMKVRESVPTAACAVRAETPPWLGDLIRKLHAKDPNDRLPTAAEALRIIEKHGSTLPPSSGRR